jgi:hypothetical protein
MPFLPPTQDPNDSTLAAASHNRNGSMCWVARSPNRMRTAREVCRQHVTDLSPPQFSENLGDGDRGCRTAAVDAALARGDGSAEHAHARARVLWRVRRLALPASEADPLALGTSFDTKSGRRTERVAGHRAAPDCWHKHIFKRWRRALQGRSQQRRISFGYQMEVGDNVVSTATSSSTTGAASCSGTTSRSATSGEHLQPHAQHRRRARCHETRRR